MKKRKHRVVVDITFDKLCTAKQATRDLQNFIEWACEAPVQNGITKTSCKEFNRVHQRLLYEEGYIRS